MPSIFFFKFYHSMGVLNVYYPLAKGWVLDMARSRFDRYSHVGASGLPDGSANSRQRQKYKQVALMRLLEEHAAWKSSLVDHLFFHTRWKKSAKAESSLSVPLRPIRRP